jgi:hypothetical protein
MRLGACVTYYWSWWFFLFREMCCGYAMAILSKSKKHFLDDVRKVCAFFARWGHKKMRYLRVDAGKVENAEETKI